MTRASEWLEWVLSPDDLSTPEMEPPPVPDSSPSEDPGCFPWDDYSQRPDENAPRWVPRLQQGQRQPRSY